MKYCAYCGKELMDEAVICSGCGCPTSLYHQRNAQAQQQVNYQQPPQQQNMPSTTNVYAILSLVFAFIFPILGIVFGKVGLNDIRKNPNQKGDGLAKAGLTLSIVLLILWIVLVILIVVLVMVFSARTGGTFQPDNSVTF